MAIRSSEYLKGKFEDGDRPTGTDFSDLVESTLNSSITSLSATNVERLRVFSSGVSAVGDLYVTENLQVDGNINAKGTLTLGDADTDNVAFNADVNSNVIPNTNNTYNLGSSAVTWKNVFSNNLSAFNILEVGSNIIVGGTVDGRDIAADGVKLDSTHTTYNSNSASYLTKVLTDSYYVNVSGDTMTGDLVLSGDGVDIIMRQSDGDYSAVLGTTSDGDGGLYLYGPGDTNASDIETLFRGGHYNSYISAGNFGVGETSPGEKLTVAGNVSAQNLISTTNANVSGAATIGGAVTVADTLQVTHGLSAAGGLSASGDVKVGRYLTVGKETHPSTDPDWLTQYRFQVEGDALIRNSGGNFALVLSGSSPDVVIKDQAGDYQAVMGTSADGGGLWVYPTGSTSPDIIFPAGHTNHSYISAGNLGINTTTPGEKLTVAGNVSAHNFIATTNALVSGTATIDGAVTIGGALSADSFKSAGGTGQTTTVSVSTNSGGKTLTFKNGLLTGVASV
jgi:hypothetical protein